MKRWIAWVFIGVVLVIALAPARILYWLPLPNNVVINQVSGSLWQGEAGTVQIDGIWLTDVRWDIHVGGLLTAKLVADVTIPAPDNPLSGQTQLALGFGGLKVTDLQADGDLSTILQLAKTQLPLTTQGAWRLEVSEFSISEPGPSAWCDTLAGEAMGRSIQVLVNGSWQSLGDFPVALGCTESGAVTLTMNGENSLGLAMQGDINSQDINISGTVRPNPRTPEGLAQMFQYLGQPDSQGRYRFSL